MLRRARQSGGHHSGAAMTHTNQATAVMQQLLLALDAYEASFSDYAATPSLLDFSHLHTKLENLQVFRVLLPQVTEQMASVATSHAELGTMLVRDRSGGFGPQHSTSDLARAREQH